MTDRASNLSGVAAAGSDPWPLACRQWQGGRSYQEDAFATAAVSHTTLDDGPAFLMVLADGMGGAAGGAIASRTVVEAFTGHFPHVGGDIGDRFRDCLDAATGSLYEQVTADPGLDGMGSTVVAVLYDGQGLSWLSVGDSPMWLFTAGRLVRLNADHSMAPVLDRLVDTGELSVEEAQTDRRRNMLRSAVTDTAADLVDCAYRSCRLRPGDFLLIASDGIETLDEDDIGKRLADSGGDAEKAADALMSAVRASASPSQDNVTYLLLSGERTSHGKSPSHLAPATATTGTGRDIVPRAGTASRRGFASLWLGAILVLAVILLFVFGLWWMEEPPQPEPGGQAVTPSEQGGSPETDDAVGEPNGNLTGPESPDLKPPVPSDPPAPPGDGALPETSANVPDEPMAIPIPPPETTIEDVPAWDGPRPGFILPSRPDVQESTTP